MWITCCGFHTYTKQEEQLTWFFSPAFKTQHNLAQLWDQGCHRSFQQVLIDGRTLKWIFCETVPSHGLPALGTLFLLTFIYLAYNYLCQFEKNLKTWLKKFASMNTFRWDLNLFWATPSSFEILLHLKLRKSSLTLLRSLINSKVWLHLPTFNLR